LTPAVKLPRPDQTLVRHDRQRVRLVHGIQLHFQRRSRAGLRMILRGQSGGGVVGLS
jgi:hypothetical protein